MKHFILFIAFILISSNINAKNGVGDITGLPIPRFVSIKSKEMNGRVGPGKDYKIKLKYQCLGYPIKVVAEFEQWRKIIDYDGSEMWVHESLITALKYYLVVHAKDDQENDLILLKYAKDQNSPSVAKIEHGVLVTPIDCEEKWCQVEYKQYKGWLMKKNLWGTL